MDALTACKLASLIYQDWPECQDGVAGLGYPNFQKWDHADTQAMLVWNGDEAALVFRGTEASKARWRDLWSNLGYPVVWAGPGRVHSGYLHAFNRIGFDAINAASRLEVPVHYGGHSMGGCVATLGAAFKPGIPTCLWTFGAPKALDRVAAAAITCEVRRYTNRFGFGPHWPPSAMLNGLGHPAAPPIRIDSGGWPRPVTRHDIDRYYAALEREKPI